MTMTTAARRAQAQIERAERIEQRGPFLVRVAGMAAALVTFITAFEPNMALRFGPFIAVVAFLLARPARFRVGLAEWALIAFLLWALTSNVWTTQPQAHSGVMTVFLSLAAMFIGVRAAIRWGRNAALAVGGYVVGCLYGLAQSSFQLVTGSGEIYVDAYGRITQVGSLNINYVAYTTVTAIVLLLLVLQGRQVTSKRMRILVIAALVVLVIGAFSTETRGVRVSVAVLLLWLLVSRVGRPLKTATFFCALAIVAVSFGWANGLLEFFDQGARTMTGLSGRLPLWEGARTAWSQSVFTGDGLGADRAQSIDNLAIHNTILGLGVTLGVVGLALFLLFAVGALNDRLQALSPADRRFRLITIMVAFTPILLTSSWEMTASGWAGLALLSTPVVAAPRPAGESAKGSKKKRAPKRARFYTIEPGTGRVRAVR